MIGNDSSSPLDPFRIAVDAYGNPVHCDVLAGIAVSGLMALRNRLAKLARAKSAPSLQIWHEGAEQISSVRQTMDKSFREMGTHLEALIHGNRECMEKARASVAATLGTNPDGSPSAESVLVTSARTCSEVLQFGEEGQDISVQIREDLDELERLSRRILRIETDIQEQMRPAEVVQVLLRIECARLDEVARAPLEALSIEIARTCQKMATTMEEEFELVEQTNQRVTGMIEHVRQLEKHQNIARLRREELTADMSMLQADAQMMAEQNEMLSAISRDLDRAVSKVMQAMQFQDIVGQRWDHIQQGVDQIARSAKWNDEVAFQCLLQHAQLVEANSEMAEALGRIDESFHAVRAASNRLADELQSTLGDPRRKEVHVRMHAVLHEALDMIRSNADEMRSADTMIAPLVDVAGKMGNHLGNVSHEMRIIALNAQIQAARFGSGTGLEVLAEGLRRIADEVGDSGLKLDADSRMIEQLAVDLRGCFETLLRDAEVLCASSDEKIPVTIDRLLQEENTGLLHLKDAVDAVNQLERIRQSMENSLSSTLVPLERLQSFAARCDQFVEVYSRSNLAVTAQIREHLVSSESSRYTMEAEKAVLHNLAHEKDGSKRQETSHTSSGEIELF